MRPALHCIVGLALFLGGAPALGAPPADADLTYSPWFRKLADPETTLSCCDESDCRYAQERVTADHYEVWIEDAWVRVPEVKIIRGLPNPTGRAVLCWSRALGVMCFVPGPGA